MIKNPWDTGVANPYALAEIIAGRRINWKKARNKMKMLESIYGMSYQDIFDPRSGSPIYAAFFKEWGIAVKQTMEEPGHGFAFSNDRAVSSELSEVKNLADLQKQLGISDLGRLAVKNLEELV